MIANILPSAVTQFRDKDTGKKDNRARRSSCPRVRRIGINELDLMEHRGKGGLCQVYDAKLKSDSMNSGRIYAVKFPRKDNPSLIKRNVQKLQQEAQLLSSISHEHIIRFEAISADEFTESGKAHPSYFIALESLSHTLSSQVTTWRSEGLDVKDASFMKERLRILLDVASGLHYLHQHNIIHRDLKPCNVGFTKDGAVRLFDFDLSVKLNPEERNEQGNYDLTGGIGTIPYMAPEIAKFKPYNEAADIYSFALLVWFIITLEAPFRVYTLRQWANEVVVLGDRPIINDAWPLPLQDLLEDSWNEVHFRPKSSSVLRILKQLIS